MSGTRASTRIYYVVLVALFPGSILLAGQNPAQLPGTSSPGAAIESATKAAARDHPKTGIVDILSDTQGVDFGPYLQDILPKVRKNWYAHIPETAQAKKGKVAIEFAVQSDGRVADMRLIATAGDLDLDRAAWEGIRASNPFPALPMAFHGPYLALRFRFYYNPDKAGLDDDKSHAMLEPFHHAVLIQSVADCNIPEYPKKALEAKVDGIVRLEAEVDTHGKVKDIKVHEGDPTLAESSSRAIREWRFQPAWKNGEKVEDRVRIKVEFRLKVQRVRAEVVWPEPLAGANPTQ